MGLAQFKHHEFICVASFFKFDTPSHPRNKKLALQNFTSWVSEGHVRLCQLVVCDLVVVLV